MQDKTTICGNRIAYDDHTPETNPDLYESAADEVEDALAIIHELQESRLNEEGDVREPLTRTHINTLQEINKEYLDSALAVLRAIGVDEDE